MIISRLKILNKNLTQRYKFYLVNWSKLKKKERQHTQCWWISMICSSDTQLNLEPVYHLITKHLSTWSFKIIIFWSGILGVGIFRNSLRKSFKPYHVQFAFNLFYEKPVLLQWLNLHVHSSMKATHCVYITLLLESPLQVLTWDFSYLSLPLQRHISWHSYLSHLHVSCS